MSTRRLLTLASASIIAALGVSPMPTLAGTGQWISYAAKFVCGTQSGPPEHPAAAGIYKTVVNIHNPHYLMEPTGAPAPVIFFKKVVVALPQGDVPFPPSCRLQEMLRADEALGVNCRNIRQQLNLAGLGPLPNPVDGFLVIEVPPQSTEQGTIVPELDVKAVYTVRHRTGTNADVSDYDVQSIDVENVGPTRFIGTPEPIFCD